MVSHYEISLIGVVGPYLDDARAALHGKNYVTAKWLGEKIGVSGQTAGMILAFLKDWEKYNNKNWRRTTGS